MRRTVERLVIGAACAWLVAGCGSGGSADPPKVPGTGAARAGHVTGSTTAAPTTTPVTTREDLEYQIVVDYGRAWDAFHDAAKAGDPNAPELAASYVEPSLSLVKGSILKLAAAKQHAVDGAHSRDTGNAVVQGILGDTATLRDCRIDDGTVVDAAGAPVDADVVTRLMEVSLVRQDGQWKIAKVNTLESWEGATRCR